MEGTRDSSTGDDRGVSEVISVVLMVAVTIVLAAMVGSVLLNIVSDVETNPIAGATAKFDAENDSIRVTYTATQDPDTTLDVSVYNVSAGNTQVGSTRTLDAVGDSTTFSVTDGDRYEVQVVAIRDGKRAVILQKDDLV